MFLYINVLLYLFIKNVENKFFFEYVLYCYVLVFKDYYIIILNLFCKMLVIVIISECIKY